jgi:glycosyltransferase involved in cell wall biosynthesis
MREKFAQRGASIKKIGVVLNSLDESRFDPRRYSSERAGGDNFVLVYHGTIDENFGLDVVIRAVALLRDRIPGLRLRVYGEGIQLPAVQELTRELDLVDRVWFSGRFYPMEQLLRCIGEADAGVVPIRRDAFRDLTHSNKMYDLISMRKPVIISRTRAVEAYFGDECFQMFESGNEVDLARAIEELHADPDLRERLVRRATEVSQRYRWVYQSKLYLDAVERLMPARATRTAAPPVAVEVVEDR